MNDTVAVLPDHRDRWRPTRAGLVSVWRYWEEEFVFHHGRLLLRGANGSGKSMALELLLPFLLDADANPNRLTSAAKSRGSLFDRVITGTDDASRTGFAWVEFVRGSEIFTIGARMRASQATRKVDLDFFTTTLAVGRELHLLDATRTALSRKALIEAVGDTGRVHASADEHRAAVRAVLFPGFSSDRYGSVIGALLALRQEKLSQNLDLGKLSHVLSEALPPLDEHDIAIVAEGFERLDRRRAELAGLEAEAGEIRQLTARQRDYARVVVVGVAGEVRTAESKRDQVTRAEREAKTELDVMLAEAATAARERQALEERIAAITIEIDALKDTDAYRHGAALADLRAQARQLRTVAAQAQVRADEQAAAHETAVRELAAAAADVEATAANLDLADRDLHAAAEYVGADGVVGEAASIDDADDAERLVHAWVDAHRARVHDVRAALGVHDQAVAARTYVEGRVTDDEATVSRRLAARAAARDDETAAVDAYRAAVTAWAAACDTIGALRLAGALPVPPDDPAAVADRIAVLAAELQAADAVAHRDLRAERDTAVEERAALVAERARWAGGGLVDPDGPSWRAPREGRLGAPLWRLVDIASGVAPADVDGLEAALTAAGLLDAWVEPDGTVDLGADRPDIGLMMRPLAGPTLADVLVPAAPVEVAETVVAGVLASIPLAHAVDPATNGEVVVALDGSYRLGAALGQGPARPAALLGAVARERHRLAQLAAIDAAIAAVDVRLAALDRRDADLDRHRVAVAAELDAVPSATPVDGARTALAAAATRLAEAEGRLDEARELLRVAEAAVRDSLRALTTAAARHGLPADAAGLVEIEVGLHRVARGAVVWARRRRELAVAAREHTRAARRVDDAGRVAARAVAELAEADREATALEGRVAALESSVGAVYSELVGRIAVLDGERAGARRRERDLGDKIPALERRVGELSAGLAAAETARAQADEARTSAHRRFVIVLDALGTDAAIRIDAPLDTTSAVLTMARTVAADHDRLDTNTQAVERLSERVRERVHAAQAALGGRVDVNRELADDGWWTLCTIVGGIRRGAGELAKSLAAELAQGHAELAAEEERLFEQTLAGSVRRALAVRIRLANALVDGINSQLDTIRTMAGGVQVRLRWEVDPEQLDAVKAARSLLLRDPADLSDAERAALQAFVRARVDQARAELEANAPWEARLRETLDYRAWHRFTLLLAHRDWDGFQPATHRRLQRLSTGERSIALHLPMIASVAAHYAGDDGQPSSCPRLILLDELFAGVDAANRAQLFGTFSTWDLDAVFTSDHEWCQYATLDGIAIHHLHPPAGDEPVTSTRFTWDGRHRLIDPPAA